MDIMDDWNLTAV